VCRLVPLEAQRPPGANENSPACRLAALTRRGVNAGSHRHSNGVPQGTTELILIQKRRIPPQKYLPLLRRTDLLMMSHLILDVPNCRRQLRCADGECPVTFLPVKTAAACLLMDPFLTSPFLRAGPPWRLPWWAARKEERGSGRQFRQPQSPSSYWPARFRPCKPTTGAAGFQQCWEAGSWWQTRNDGASSYMYGRPCAGNCILQPSLTGLIFPASPTRHWSALAASRHVARRTGLFSAAPIGAHDIS
jgi:hypothetical protein